MNTKRILYGEFINGFWKRVLIILVILIGLLNYLNFKYLGLVDFLRFSETYWKYLNIGTIWMILTIWILIWMVSYPYNRRGF